MPGFFELIPNLLPNARLLLTSTAAKDDAVLKEIQEQAERVFSDAWNFKLAVVESSPITVGTLFLGILFLVLGVIMSRFFSRRLSRQITTRLSLDLGVKHTLESVSFYVLLIIFTLFAMRMANLPITIFTVIGGALAIGIGFGSQNIVNNFISGIILMIERPIKVGDIIETNATIGRVVDIGMRSTVVRSFGNKHYIVPNSTFLENEVLNWTHRADDQVRIPVRVGVNYGSNTRKVEELLIESVNAEKRVLHGKKPLVIFVDFGDNALIFDVYFWIKLKDLMDKRLIESNIRFRIDDLFRKAGLIIAFPQRDVHLYPQGPIEVSLNKS